MWLGAPHISRSHATVVLAEDGSVQIADNSTNGIGFEGQIIGKGRVQDLGQRPAVLDFGAAVTVGICFDEAQEQRFLDAGGGLHAFLPDHEDFRPATNPNLQVDQGMQLRQVTSRGFSAEKAYAGSSRRRPYVKGLMVIVLIAAGFIGMIVFELLRGGWSLGGSQ
jgi:hypothetical protein